MESTACRLTFHRHTAQSAADRSIPRSMACRHTPSLTMFFEIASSEKIYHNVDELMNSNCERRKHNFCQMNLWKQKKYIQNTGENKNGVLPPNQLKPITTISQASHPTLNCENYSNKLLSGHFSEFEQHFCLPRIENTFVSKMIATPKFSQADQKIHIQQRMFVPFLFVGGPSFSKDIEPEGIFSVQLIEHAKMVNYFFLFQAAWVSSSGQSALQSAIQR